MIKSSEAYQKAIVADGRRMYVKAVVDIIDPDIVQGDVSGSEQQEGISRPEQLWDKKFESTASYASMEPGRSLLNGWYTALPPGSAERDWEAGFTGAVLSGWDGLFPVPQIMQIEFSNVSILQAMSVAFSDRPEDGVAADFTVEVFSEGVAYYTKTVTGNTKPLVALSGWRVNHPDTIRVTVTRWSLPRRRMRGLELVPGVYEVWTGDELSEVSVKMQGDPSCLTLPYGTASLGMDNQDRRFDPRTKGGVFLSIEERQGVELYLGPGLPDGTVEYKPLGVFYQSGGGWRDGDNGVTMVWRLVDIIGLLAGRRYLPSGPPPATLGGWLEELAGQLGENFRGRVRVDPDYGDRPVTATAEELEGMTCGDILRGVCMATGTWPRADASTGFLTAEPLWNEGSKITLDNLNQYPALSANQDAAAVTVNGHTAMGNAPACGETVEVDNPFLGEGTNLEAVRAILASFGGNRLELVGRGDPASEIGDVDTVWLAEGNATAARRVRQELSFSSGVLKGCKSSFLRGDGMFLFENRVQILESGTWTVPEGVWRLRVVLVGHGQAGGRGGDGVWNNSSNRFMGQYDYPQAPNGGYGGDGGSGSGGRVWEGVIDVNPGQVIQVEVGASTVLWNYSSADGKVYPNGFTDIATGDVFGRSGVSNPKPGSGDGGVGGRGGTAGKWYVRGHWYYDDGYVPPFGWSEAGVGVDPNHDAPGHWEQEVVIVSYPTAGTPGSPGALGCAILYYEKPEVVDGDGA